MPRNVRNFWVRVNVDGKKTPVATGPRRRDGGFSCNIQMRSDGDIHPDEVTVEGKNNGGLLVLKVWVRNNVIFQRTTKA